MSKHFPLLILGLLLAACGPLAGANSDSARPSSWFDAPLPGSSFTPPNPIVQLVSHHSDPSGIAQLEFSVNDEVFETADVQSGDALITDTRDWSPPGPGEYTLRVRTKNKNGVWGNYAETYVMVPNIPDVLPVGGIVEGAVYYPANPANPQDLKTINPLEGVEVKLKGCGPDQTQTTPADGKFLFNQLPAGSCTLEVSKPGWAYVAHIHGTEDPTLGPYPVPVTLGSNELWPVSIIMSQANLFEQIGFSDKSLDTNLVYTGSCSPNQVTFAIKAVHPDGIRTMTFFYHLTSPDGETSPWSNGEAMSPAGSDHYTLTLTGDHLDSDSGFSQATVSYQFVIEPVGGSSADFVRSEVFADLLLTACGGGPAPSGPSPTPPPAGPTPTNTPYVPVVK